MVTAHLRVYRAFQEQPAEVLVRYLDSGIILPAFLMEQVAAEVHPTRWHFGAIKVLLLAGPATPTNSLTDVFLTRLTQCALAEGSAREAK